MSVVAATSPRTILRTSKAASHWLFPIAVAAIILLAAAIRFIACRNAFWFDEILSWKLARDAPNVGDLLLNTPIDNNHPLNTLWIYLLKNQLWWPAFRMFSLVTGVALVGAIGWLARRTSKSNGFIAAVLSACSIFMIQYSSEARGYAPAMLFAVLSYAFATLYIDQPRRRYSLAMTACVILGFFSHPSFACIYLAVLAWSILAIHKRNPRSESLRQIFRLHAVSAVFTLMYALLVLRRIQPGGGAPFSRWRAARDAIAWLFGWPDSGWMTALLYISIAAILLIEIVRLFHAQRDDWLFYAIAIVIAPALALCAWRQPYVYPRYFAISAPFVILLVSSFLARAWNAQGAARSGCTIFLALFLWGNARQFGNLISPGRGQYLQALNYMLAHSRDPVTIGSHQDLRNNLVFDFYKRYLPANRTIQYIPQSAYTATSPQWLIADSLHDSPSDSPIRRTNTGAEYRLVRTFRYGGLSGFDWWIFERQSSNQPRRPPR